MKRALRGMCGVVVKRRFEIGSAVAALVVLASTASYALDEQQMPVAPSSAPQQAAPADAPQSGVQDTAPIAKSGETGTDIVIPGIGKLGVLPKMDFGLELLYGVAEEKQPEAQGPLENQPEDLTIRGSVKHKF